MRRSLILMVVAVALLAGACSSGASGEVVIHTVSNEDIDSGTFTASGGVVCSDGTFENETFNFTDTLFTYGDRYECADGTGSFVMSAELPWDPDVEEPGELEGTWTVSDGTGDHSGLTGSGTIVSKLFVDGTETYTGEMDRP